MIIKPFSKQLRKIQVGLRGDAEQVYLRAMLPLIRKEKGFRLLAGSAPRGELERMLQEFLSEVLPAKKEL